MKPRSNKQISITVDKLLKSISDLFPDKEPGFGLFLIKQGSLEIIPFKNKKNGYKITIYTK